MAGLSDNVLRLTLWAKIFGLLLSIIVVIVNATEIHLLRKTSNKQFYEKISSRKLGA